jgi:Ca2+-binding EF-hand superfamily protein
MSKERNFDCFIRTNFLNLFRADVNHDKRVSKEELVNYVFKNVQKHLQEAKQKNSKLFVLIDSNQDGQI